VRFAHEKSNQRAKTNPQIHQLVTLARQRETRRILANRATGCQIRFMDDILKYKPR
jgi:hypothetical protein